MAPVVSNETLRTIFDRKSIRAFEDRPIPNGDKALILEAAAAAPTAGNQQMYTILDITDQRIKDELAHWCDDQPFIARAPLVLVFCADMAKWYDAFTIVGAEPRDPGIGDLMLSVVDTTIAAQNAVIAAESLGIGSCYIGDILENAEEVNRLLALPDLVVPAVTVVFGYATPTQLSRPKTSRFDQRHIVHDNTYRRLLEPELREMFKHRTGHVGFHGWVRAFCERKYNSVFAREMSRSTQVHVDTFTAARHPER